MSRITLLLFLTLPTLWVWFSYQENYQQCYQTIKLAKSDKFNRSINEWLYKYIYGKEYDQISNSFILDESVIIGFQIPDNYSNYPFISDFKNSNFFYLEPPDWDTLGVTTSLITYTITNNGKIYTPKDSVFTFNFIEKGYNIDISITENESMINSREPSLDYANLNSNTYINCNEIGVNSRYTTNRITKSLKH